MPSPGNVATPATAATVVVPERVPLPGFAPSATVTLPPSLPTRRPSAPSAVICTAGVIAAPATVLLGWTLKLSCVAAPAVMLNGVEIGRASCRERVVSSEVVPTLLIQSTGNDDT